MLDIDIAPGDRLIGRIPVRNLWFLMLYASDLARTGDICQVATDAEIDDLPDLIARLLSDCVERRLRRNLTRGYRQRKQILTRVRGRIDILSTEARQLLSKGKVLCHFEDYTYDTPRNRYVHSALDLMTQVVQSRGLVRRCRSLAAILERSGVGRQRPSRSELAHDQIGRNDSADRLMLALARLAFDIALPLEDPGFKSLILPEREEVWVRRLFEKAILGFARIELDPLGWSVRGGVPLDWQVAYPSDGISAILPRMLTDIVIDPPHGGQRVLIDTKFTSVLKKGRFNNASFESKYLYQMYSYIRSQEGLDPRWDNAAGLFLHPAVEQELHEFVTIQNHPIGFATVDLGGSAGTIRKQLRKIFRFERYSEPST